MSGGHRMKERKSRSSNRKRNAPDASAQPDSSQALVSRPLKESSMVMVWKGDSQNSLAKSLVTLIAQVTPDFPGGRTDSDGTIGDASHRAEGKLSDHNPNDRAGGMGIVTAL